MMCEDSNKKLIPVLKRIQAKEGFISQENFKKVADEFGVSVGEVFSAATFYSFLSTEPRGKNVIMVCKNLPCELKAISSILEAIKTKLGIDIGQTTKDKMFSLLLTDCIGACDRAPAMMINEKIFDKLTPEKVNDILDAY